MATPVVTETKLRARMDPSRLRRLTPTIVLPDAEGVVMLLTRSAPSAAVVLRCEQLVLQLAPRYPKAVGILNVALDDKHDGAISEAARAAIASAAKRVNAHIGGIALVVPREGFAAALIRSVASGMFLLTRPPFPARSFASNDEGVAFLCDALDRVRAQPVDRATLTATLDEALAELRRED